MLDWQILILKALGTIGNILKNQISNFSVFWTSSTEKNLGKV